MLEDEVWSRSKNTSHKLIFENNFELEEYSSISENATYSVWLLCHSGPKKPKVELQMLFKFITVAKDSLAC